jgi:MFS family permease
VLGRRATGDRTPFPPGFGTIWTTVALDLIGFGIVLPILPLYAERFGASATTIGILMATFSVAQLLLAPVWGRVSDRVGRKPVILISLFGTAAGS